MKEYKKIIDAAFASADMKKHLLSLEADEDLVSGIIRAAPISLFEKEKLACGEDKDAIKAAIRELTCIRPGEILYRKWAPYATKNSVLRYDAPYCSYAALICAIAEYRTLYKSRTTDIIEKWVPDGSGTMRLVYTYEAIGESIMYFSRPDSSEPYRFSFEARNLKLPTPFLPGDKVFFGTQPEVSPQNGVILTAGERLRALYLDGDGYYKIVSLSSSLPDDAYCNLSISPLFSIGYQRKRLPKRENLLNALSKFIAHSTTRGFSVCKAVSEASFYGITAEELMDIIA